MQSGPSRTALPWISYVYVFAHISEILVLILPVYIFTQLTKYSSLYACTVNARHIRSRPLPGWAHLRIQSGHGAHFRTVSQAGKKKFVGRVEGYSKG
jgi:hypothetical protein